MDLKEIGLTIKKARENYLLTLRELAELTNEDHSNLSKIEKGKINISMDRFLKIISVLNFKMQRNHINETTISNLDFINKNLGVLTIKEIASKIKVDRTKLKKDLIVLSKFGKVDEDKIKTIRPKSVKYKKEIELFQTMKIGRVEKIVSEKTSKITYLRQILKSLPKKDFITRKESDGNYLIVRIK